MSTGQPAHPWVKELKALEKRLADFDFAEGEDEDMEDEAEPDKDAFMNILKDACDLVRRGDANGLSDLGGLVDDVHTFIERAVDIACRDKNLYDFIPSFGHHDEHAPLVKDSERIIMGEGQLGLVMMFFRQLFGDIPGPVPAGMRNPKPWDAASQPHANTTPLSRFRTGLGIFSATEATPLANVIYQARCEIFSDDICSPMRLGLSSGGSCLAVLAAGGWKNRDPAMHYYLQNEDTSQPLKELEPQTIIPGLSAVAHYLALDESRKLTFIADSARIKSYGWDSGVDSWHGPARGVHTLRCDGHDGPITILSDGRILRAGRGSALVWNIDQLETHGPSGKKKIGEGRFNTEDTWRDEPSEIEKSTGSIPHATAPFARIDFRPALWHVHQPTGWLLCGEDEHRGKQFGCVALDLEHGGKIAARYIGQGGATNEFSTSENDPNVFVSACSDGYVRLFDVRHPLPTVTFDVENSSSQIFSSVLAHPDGIPTLFTGGTSTQRISMWDVRARKTVYEMSTGNNVVLSMAWDPSRSRLYAATECEYRDWMGKTHNYRYVRKPKKEKGAAGDDNMEEDPEGDKDENDDAMDDDEASDSEGSDWDDERRCWPETAYHSEYYYGRIFDAGDHKLYCYQFKADADMRVTPPYGHATVGDPWNTW